jgi:hypothetical protein
MYEVVVTMTDYLTVTLCLRDCFATATQRTQSTTTDCAATPSQITGVWGIAACSNCIVYEYNDIAVSCAAGRLLAD